VNWAQIEPQKGRYDFSAVDGCVRALAKKKVAIGAGPLLRFSKQYLPKWLLRSGAGFEKIRETAYQFVSRMVSRYEGSIRVWRVVSGLNIYNHFGFNFEQVLEMTRATNMAAKAASDRALKIVEISNPWGEYYATVASSIPPLVYMDMVVQSGINFDAFALQMQFGKDYMGMHVRDMMQISAILDYFGRTGKPLYVTDVEVPSVNGTDSYAGDVAGIWRRRWDESLQGEWIEQFYKIALSKAFVDTVIYANLADTKDGAIANSGLLTAELKPKKSFEALKKLHGIAFGR